MSTATNALATDQLVEFIAARIAEGYAPEQIFLFGSYAFGTATADSDLDLLIVKKTTGTQAKRQAEVRRLLRGLAFPLDILVYTPEEFESRRNDPNSFVFNALLTARPIYVKA